MYNLGILLIFDTHFSGKNFVPPPKVDWAPTLMVGPKSLGSELRSVR